MNYIEYNIQVPGPDEAEIVVAELAELGFESFSDYLPDGFMPGAGSVKGYIPDTAEQEGTTHTAIQNFLYCESYPYERNEIEQQNWNAEWESRFEPIDILDGMCYIRAPFHEPKAGGAKHEIVIMPKMSFGTGHHATTYLMAEQMLAMDFAGASVLDMGSGTGILAILAAMRGAVVLDAVDIDTWAYENCLENIQTNGVQTVVCPILGDVTAVAGKVYDYVLANINRNILLNDIRHYSECMKPEAFLYMSGFYVQDIPAIEQECKRNGLALLSYTEKNNWAAVKVQKQLH